jgi:hypothetical protein
MKKNKRSKKKRPKKHRSKKQRETTPVTMLAGELAILRRDLRKTIRAYASRLEIALAQSTVAVSSKRAEALSREQLHDIRDLTIMVRKRKLKPEKGRRKDLRKIDSLIHDLHSITHPAEFQNSSK